MCLLSCAGLVIRSGANIRSMEEKMSKIGQSSFSAVDRPLGSAYLAVICGGQRMLKIPREIVKDRPLGSAYLAVLSSTKLQRS